jgi:hypothetical protein
MFRPVIRSFIFLSIFFLCNSQTLHAQNFIKEYGKYLLDKMAKDGDEQAIIYRKRLINSNVSILKSVLDKTSKVNKQLFYKADTIYIVYSSNVAQEDGGFPIPPYSTLIWNPHRLSCYFKTHIEVKNEKPKVILDTIKFHASNKLAELDNELKTIIEKADTLGYTNYIKTTSFKKPITLYFTVAIESNGHWKFISSKSYITD